MCQVSDLEHGGEHEHVERHLRRRDAVPVHRPGHQHNRLHTASNAHISHEPPQQSVRLGTTMMEVMIVTAAE